MLVLAIELLDSLTQSSYKRQEAGMTKSKGFSDAYNRAIALVGKDLQLLVSFLNLV
jgi:hypothetical protein